MTTTEVVSIDSLGFRCQNVNQPNGWPTCNAYPCPCSNYEVRFCCARGPQTTSKLPYNHFAAVNLLQEGVGTLNYD